MPRPARANGYKTQTDKVSPCAPTFFSKTSGGCDLYDTPDYFAAARAPVLCCRQASISPWSYSPSLVDDTIAPRGPPSR